MSKRTLAATVTSICVIAAAVLLGCDGGSSGDQEPVEQTNLTPLLITDPLTKNTNTIDAARLLTQASYFATAKSRSIWQQ